MTRRTLCISFAVAIIVALLVCLPAYACNCSIHLGACSARVTFQHESAHVQASTSQCAQVTYTINGNPGSLTVEGAGDEDWLGVSDGAAVGNVTCTLCAADSAVLPGRGPGGIAVDVNPNGRPSNKLDGIRDNALKSLHDH